MVQKIGFLLGEGASEIEQMLNSDIPNLQRGGCQQHRKQQNKIMYV
jgi:hypothetical protein